MVKTVHNALAGDVILDCDVVTVPDSDIKLVVYSATEGGPDAEKLQFLRVAADLGPLAEGWRIRPGAPGYADRLTAEQLRQKLAEAKRDRDR